MNRVGEFEKVSFEQFCSAMKAEFYKQDDASKTAEEAISSLYDAIKLPERSTAGSAGYDFVSPTSFVLEPGQSIKIPTGIRCRIDEGWWLGCFPRSGLGFKYRLQLDNTVYPPFFGRHELLFHVVCKSTCYLLGSRFLIIRVLRQ